MNNNNQNPGHPGFIPFGMGPSPFMMPPWMYQQEQHRRDVTEIVVPPRVEKALEFLAMLTHKTRTIPAISEIAIETIEGQKLTDEEATAQATACNMLSKYFVGKLTPDIWEQAYVEAQKLKLKTNGQEGAVTDCMVCRKHPNPQCKLCKGSGKVFITSFANDPTYPADAEYEE